MAAEQPHEEKKASSPSKLQLSLDWWAVIVALACISLIGIGVITAVPW
jgi:hypothetical protein